MDARMWVLIFLWAVRDDADTIIPKVLLRHYLTTFNISVSLLIILWFLFRSNNITFKKLVYFAFNRFSNCCWDVTSGFPWRVYNSISSFGNLLFLGAGSVTLVDVFADYMIMFIYKSGNSYTSFSFKTDILFTFRPYCLCVSSSIFTFIRPSHFIASVSLNLLINCPHPYFLRYSSASSQFLKVIPATRTFDGHFISIELYKRKWPQLKLIKFT